MKWLSIAVEPTSKIAHLHRRIVKEASSMHAKATIAASNGHLLPPGEDQSFEFPKKKWSTSIQAQDAWS